MKSKSDEILHHNNTISRLKKELEDNQLETYGLEAKKDKVVQAAAERTREIGQVRRRLPTVHMLFHILGHVVPPAIHHVYSRLLHEHRLLQGILLTFQQLHLGA